jgi:hypothetical protein
MVLETAIASSPQPHPVPHQLTDDGGILRLLKEHLANLRTHRRHPNRTLHYDDLLVALLVSFFEPSVRSLRTMDDASASQSYMQANISVKRLPKSTLGDALASMNPDALLPILKRLMLRVPNLQRRDADLAGLQRILAIDGSFFNVPADVLWAIRQVRRNGKPAREVRLNLALDVLEFIPAGLSLSGDDGCSEARAFIPLLRPDAVYLADRNFVDFTFLKAVLDIGSDFVVRLKSINHFAPLYAQNLDLDDRDAGVVGDTVGLVPGVKTASGLGARHLREVVLIDPQTHKPVRLLTSLLEVPAHIIGKLYRYRWMIELFFRWLKCVARVRHAMSQTRNGITLQFYAALIAVLATYLVTGTRPGLYEYNMLAGVMRGTSIPQGMLEVLARRGRERELERLRKARKKLAQ